MSPERPAGRSQTHPGGDPIDFGPVTYYDDDIGPVLIDIHGTLDHNVVHLVATVYDHNGCRIDHDDDPGAAE